MSALEQDVIPTAGEMMDNLITSVDVLQRWTIGKWAVKTAMVWEHVTRAREIFYTKEECRALKEQDTIPANTTVWLSRYEGDEIFFSHANDASNLPWNGPKVQAYITTLLYNCLVVQVLTVRPEENYSGPLPQLDCDQQKWHPVLLQIWPTVNIAVWPPLTNLGAGALETFHKRCGSHELDDHENVIQIRPENK